MRYTFSVRRTTALTLLAGLALCFALTFLAGWVVGVSTQVSPLVADTAATAPAETPGPDAEVRESTPRIASASTLPNPSVGTDAHNQEETAESDGSTSDPASPPEDASTASTSETGAFTIQIGSFAVPSNARRLADRVRADGASVRIHASREQGQMLHDVWVGSYDTQAAAARQVDALRDYTGSAFVTRTSSIP